MAPRGRKKKAGLMREDAARDAMRAFGFEERVINVCIKELLEVYGEEGWFLIEECSYMVLLNKCLEKQAEQGKVLAEEMDEEQHKEIAEAEQEHTPQQEEEEEEEEHEQVEDGGDHVGSSSTSLVDCGVETSTHTCQTDVLSNTSETDILDPSPTTIPVIDYASPVAFPSADALGDYAQHSVGGAKSSGCGWLSEDEETDQDEDSIGDDDEMIQLTPQPLCEELEELINEIRGEKKRKRVSRWEN